MVQLDKSQQRFCNSPYRNIRLLAPAGCGKTAALLYRCRELFRRSKDNQRFLIVTFTKVATAELRERFNNDPEFNELQNQIDVFTLNAYGWREIRKHFLNPEMLTDDSALRRAMMKQLEDAWSDNSYIASAAKRRGNGAARIMKVMDNLKSMGFDHTEDVDLKAFNARFKKISDQGLEWRFDEQFKTLTDLRILDEKTSTGKIRTPYQKRVAFYNRFFRFWCDATEVLHKESMFTFEGQKYWTYLDLKSPGPDGKRKRRITEAKRYHHVFVDEFQDVNPLDLALVRVIAERHRSTLTIVGDDDQAIFEWRGASPEFILKPEKYLGTKFRAYQLRTNYRSPQKIIKHASRLINNNKNRDTKRVRSAVNSVDATIELLPTVGTNERLERVTDIVRGTQSGKVAVIGRLKRQLIPFQIYYASDGMPFYTAEDLNIFKSKAFDNFMNLLEIWNRVKTSQRPRKAIEDALTICDRIKLLPLSSRDRRKLSDHLSASRPKTTVDAVESIARYSGTLSGKTHLRLHDAASKFVNSVSVTNAIRTISDGFDGLNVDEERAKDDVWYTDPPLIQLAEISEGEGLDAYDLIDRIERVKENLEEFKAFEDGSEYGDTVGFLQRPLHLMTAHRAKGKEFETVVILDTDDRTWPLRPDDDQRRIEAERRLFYVAFTRARQKVILLHEKGATLSPFVKELGRF